MSELALHDLVRERKSEQIEIAVQAGVQIDARNASGLTPLMIAIEQDDLKSVQVLLRLGADPTLVWANPRHSSWARAMAQPGGVRLGEALLEAVDDPRSLSRSGSPEGEETVYLWTHLFALNRKGAGGLARRLIERGLDPNERLPNGMTPLLIAAAKSDAKTAEVASVLLEAGADPEAQTDVNHSYLRRREAELKELEATGTDVSRLRSKPVEHKPRTVLQLARENSKKAYEIFQELLSAIPKTLDRFDQATAEIARLPSASENASFTSLAAELGGMLGEGKPVRGKPGVLQFAVKLRQVPALDKDTSEDEMQRLAPLQNQARLASAMLIYQNDADTLDTKIKLLLLPTRDWAAPLCLAKTDGANYGLTTRDIVNRLGELHQRFPFELDGCGKDFAAMRFESPRDLVALQNELVSLCPDYGESLDSLTDELEQDNQDGRCYLWWD